MKESKLQYKILRYIESNFPGSVCFKLEKCSKDGVPDIFYAIPGYTSTFAEIKRSEKEKLRPNQIAMKNALNNANQRSIEIKSWEQWMAEVENIRKTIA